MKKSRIKLKLLKKRKKQNHYKGENKKYKKAKMMQIRINKK